MEGLLKYTSMLSDNSDLEVKEVLYCSLWNHPMDVRTIEQEVIDVCVVCDSSSSTRNDVFDDVQKIWIFIHSCCFSVCLIFLPLSLFFLVSL
jgi:hypothetical protein